MYETRLNRVLAGMAYKKIPQMLISDPAAIFYLTGSWIDPGERMLVYYISLDGHNKLFINELFPINSRGIDTIWFNDTHDGVALLSEHIIKSQRIGVDKNWPARFLLRLMEVKGDSDFVNGSVVLDKIRMCKDETEIELMRSASRANDAAMGKIIGMLSERYTEKGIAAILANVYEELGTQGCSFDPIIAYGANAANPHHLSANAKPKAGDSIIIDTGCRKEFYCSDMTRTVFYKHADERCRKVFTIVLDANKRAIAAVKPGVRFCDIDAAARGYIEQKGYGKYFTHRTGHSIGIEVHDYGDVSAVNTDVLEPGMIFSVEPGIYLPGEFGVRIEDLVVVTDNGCEVLNEYNTELTIVE